MSESKVVFYLSPVAPLTNEEIQHIFAKYHPGDPIMVALRQILAQRLAAATSDNIDATLNERAAGMVAGRMQEISDFQTELAAFHKAAAQLRPQAKATPN